MLDGLTAIDCKVAPAAVTVRGVDPVTTPSIVWMVAEPLAIPMARPVLLIVAMEELLELHLT